MNNTLPRTMNAIYMLQSRQDLLNGDHIVMKPQVSSSGLLIGHVNLDLSSHTAEQYDPMALEELILGIPQATDTLPDDELPVNIVVYREEQRELDYPFNLITDAKTQLINILARAIWSAKTPFDPGRLRIIGSSQGFEGDKVATIDHRPKNTEQAAAVITNLFKPHGVNFLITDNVAGLVEQGLELKGPGRTVVVSAQHELEQVLPSGIGKFSFGKLREVNTNNPRELKRTNAKNLVRHQAAIDNLRKMAVPVVLVTYNGRNHREGYDVRSTDMKLAKALVKLTTTRRS